MHSLKVKHYVGIILCLLSAKDDLLYEWEKTEVWKWIILKYIYLIPFKCWCLQPNGR